MTDTEVLAGLLRDAAEQWPEKFEIEDMEEMSGRFIMKGSNEWEAILEHIDEHFHFPSDCMDAIAEAVGMRFTVDMDAHGDYWYTTSMKDDSDEWQMVSVTPLEYETKRSASIAALISILKYKLEH